MPGRKKNKVDESVIQKDYDLPNPPCGGVRQISEHYKNLYKPENADITGRLVAAGFTEKDLAFTFNVPLEAIDAWKRNEPAFMLACVEGKQREKKKLVAKSLLAAVGYDYETSKTKTHKDADGIITKIEETKFKSHQPANHNLLMFLLCNLSHQLGDEESESWQSKQKLEVDQTRNVTVNITGELATEQIRKLAGKLLEEPRKVIESKEVINEV